MIYLITDPLELYENGRIIKCYEGSFDSEIITIDTVEQIR